MTYICASKSLGSFSQMQIIRLLSQPADINTGNVIFEKLSK